MKTTFNSLVEKVTDITNAATVAKKTADATKTQAAKAFRKALGN